MSEAKHSPLPWSKLDDYKESVICDANGEPIMVSENDGCPSDPGWDYVAISDADRDFILRACNNHEALVDACRSALIRIEELAGEKLHDYCGCTCCELKQAIAKATK